MGNVDMRRLDMKGVGSFCFFTLLACVDKKEKGKDNQNQRRKKKNSNKKEKKYNISSYQGCGADWICEGIEQKRVYMIESMLKNPMVIILKIQNKIKEILNFLLSFSHL